MTEENNNVKKYVEMAIQTNAPELASAESIIKIEKTNTFEKANTSEKSYTNLNSNRNNKVHIYPSDFLLKKIKKKYFRINE